VLAVSARHGWGVDELRAMIAKRVAEKKVTRSRLEADVKSAAQRLQDAAGKREVRGAKQRALRDEAVNTRADQHQPRIGFEPAIFRFVDNAISPAAASGGVRGGGVGFPRVIVVDAGQALGSQTRLFSRECAQHVVREFWPPAWIQDVAVARLAAQCAPLLYHVPSLVQHTDRECT